MIYFNNAAESYPKPLAIQEVVRDLPFYENGRNCNCASHSSPAEEFRVKLAKFLNLPDNYQVTITNSATESANIILRSFDKEDLVKFDNRAHNCVVRTCNEFFKNNYLFHEANTDFELISGYCLVHQSNVDGSIIDVKQEIEKLKEFYPNLRAIIVDISQSIGNVDVDVSSWNYDNVYVFGTMHKFMGSICGCGFICHPKINFLKPLITGGTGTVSNDYKQPNQFPNYLESGTKNSLAITCAIKSIDINDKLLMQLNNDAKTRLVKLYKERFEESDKDLFNKFFITRNVNDNVPYINLIPYKPVVGDFITTELHKKNIIVRFGCHCVPFFRFKKDDKKYHESIRLSFNQFNSGSEIYTFFDELSDILVKNYKTLSKL